jgi:hypothetical protein
MRFGIWRHRYRYPGTCHDRPSRAPGHALRALRGKDQAVLIIGSKRPVHRSCIDVSYASVALLTPLSVGVYCEPTAPAANPAYWRGNPGSHSDCWP